jgi:competence protein ComEA
MKVTQSVVALLCIMMLSAAISAQAADGRGVVNINKAGPDQLMLLPRIGPSVAQRIIDHRDKNGQFKSKEDLMLVRGIGEVTFTLIEPHITVSGETTLTEKVQVPKKNAEGP